MPYNYAVSFFAMAVTIGSRLLILPIEGGMVRQKLEQNSRRNRGKQRRIPGRFAASCVSYSRPYYLMHVHSAVEIEILHACITNV